MSRIARIVVPDVPHHLTHRGNRGEEVFRSPVDRFAYIDLLRAHCVLFFRDLRVIEKIILLHYFLFHTSDFSLHFSLLTSDFSLLT